MTEQGVSTTCLVIDSDGERQAHYDKLHMFDVDVADSHKQYRESAIFNAGDESVVVDSPFGRLGLSICYDVRFPHLYSELVQKGAQIIIVPAAFTAVTGQAHWETLLRARAIETQCWVVAVNQAGTHPCGRQTWGHSMVITPWGEVTVSAQQEAVSFVAEIELAQIQQIRSAMPVAQHARFENKFKRQ